MKAELKRYIQLWLLRLSARLFPVKVVRTEKEKKIFTKLWHSIWLEEGYAQPNEPIIEKYEKYDKFSTDFLVKFLGVFPVGTLRIIHNNNEVGLPVLNDFETKRCWQSDNIVEATLLTVSKKFRSRVKHIPSLVLMRELVRYGKNHNLEGAVMAVDQRLFFAMKRKLCFPLYQIGPEKFYEGSITYPAFIRTEEFYRVMGEVNPFFTS
jgi:hypothetical protein